jgi:tRNA threonylcarbamoyl adenosine modification protein YeaZ
LDYNFGLEKFMSSKLILALSTSDKEGSIALSSACGRIFERKLPVGQSHAESLHPAVDSLLAEAGIRLTEIQGFAVDQGPGSFTGIRVGLAAVRAWSFCGGQPIYLCDAFSIMREELGLSHPPFSDQATQTPQAQGVVSAIEAQSGKFFFYSDNVISLICKQRLKDREFWEPFRSRNLTAFGNLSQNLLSEAYKFSITLALSPVTYPSARALLNLALMASETEWTKDWKLALPLYLRASAAEENRMKTRSTPL